MSDESKENILREVKRQNLKRKPKLSSKVAGAFNLQAFAFPFLYNIIYKRYPLAIIFVILTAIPHIIPNLVSASFYIFTVWTVGILSLILAIVSGTTGNVSAYSARNYSDEYDFIQSQKYWIPAAIVAIIVHIFIFPAQITGHQNTSQMIKFADARQVFRLGLLESYNDPNRLGIEVTAEKIAPHLSHFIDGDFNGIDTIKMANGVVYRIEGYLRECGTKEDNSFYGEKSACATVTIDLNGNKGPNLKPGIDDVKKLKATLNRSTKLHDVYTLYAYQNDLLPMEGTVEQYALRRFKKD